MDSSQNWLSFSLSNQSSHNSSNICLFEAFNTNHGVGPKLEDFLGSGSAPLGRFSATETDGRIYESELKKIAAGFLGGFPADGEKGVSPAEVVTKKAVETVGQRTSIYRGVTRHRWTGRYEAHLWDNSCRREGQSRKGRQVYLGGYDKEEKAARAYDLAALKYWGPTTTTNLQVSNYEKELEEMKNLTRQEFVASLRRKSSGFSRGASIYRGVTRSDTLEDWHHQHGRWQARIGRVAGNKDLYLGTFSTQEEAAEAYDIAAIKFRGLNAVTNFEMSRYDVKNIANSNLPIGGIKSRPSDSSSSDTKSSESKQTDLSIVSSQPSNLSLSQPIKPEHLQDYWSLLALPNPSQTNPKSKPTLPQYNYMDFSSAPSINQSNGSFLNGGIFQQQDPCVPYPTQGDSSSSYGSWATTASIHTFQPAKPNLAVFQTPIFGME